MMKLMRFFLLLALLTLSIGSAASQIPPPDSNLSGTWELSMTANLPNQATCMFEGSAQVTQMNGTVTGSAIQMLVGGSTDSCPSSMTADISGTLVGTRLTGTLDGGPQFGTADFTGDVGPDGMSLTGNFSTPGFNGQAANSAPAALDLTPAGPFPGITGAWAALVTMPEEIPTLSSLGLAVLVALVLLTSLLILRRSPA